MFQKSFTRIGGLIFSIAQFYANKMGSSRIFLLLLITGFGKEYFLSSMNNALTCSLNPVIANFLVEFSLRFLKHGSSGADGGSESLAEGERVIVSKFEGNEFATNHLHRPKM